MRKSILALVLLPLFLSVKAQSLIGGKNIVKLNLSSLALGAYNVTYERKLLPHITASLGISKMPSRGVPFKSTVENLLNSSYIDYANAQVSNFSITPELRLYLIGAGHGLYVAPYARYSSMDFSVPLKYQTTISGIDVAKYAIFSGNVRATSGGLMIGTQHQILKKLVIDIWILGGHYGSSSGNLTATYKPQDPSNATVSAYEKETLKNAISSVTPSVFKVSGSVSKTSPSALISVNGPWAGIRAVGINLGLRF